MQTFNLKVIIGFTRMIIRRIINPHVSVVPIQVVIKLFNYSEMSPGSPESPGPLESPGSLESPESPGSPSSSAFRVILNSGQFDLVGPPNQSCSGCERSD